MTANKLKIVLCWHMHQAWSWDPLTARFAMPWTYLHGIREYVDIAAQVESVPGARAVLNFTPTLLEQLSDYEARIALSLTKGVDIGDPLLDALRAQRLASEPLSREPLLRACIEAHGQHQIARHPPYARLADLARRCITTPAINDYLNEQYVADLLVWYHLAWLGETVRADSRVERLVAKESGYDHSDRMELLGLIGELVAGIVPRCRRLAAAGQVELSVTPYAHPIAPLLIDFTTAREAAPGVSLPQSGAYPGGIERARWHVDKAILVFEHVFGSRPAGLWPAEGAVSAPLLSLLDEFGFQWTATGRATIGHSVARAGGTALAPCAHRLQGSNVAVFHRDDGLSDRIAYSYAGWNVPDAVDDIVKYLHGLHASLADAGTGVVPIIVSAEDVWRQYPENGREFLQMLLHRLVGDPLLELTTFGEALRLGVGVQTLPTLVAGSWLYGNFTAWIGETEKNHAWDRLCEVKRAVDEVVALGTISDQRRREVEQQLAICEASDWFQSTGRQRAVDRAGVIGALFDQQLLKLYQLIGVRAPGPK
jgi:alpha-amylase/alpha-mannosidase (GH57 family)